LASGLALVPVPVLLQVVSVMSSVLGSVLVQVWLPVLVSA